MQQLSFFSVDEILKVEKGKTCTKCNKYLPISFFPYSPDKLYKVRNECKKCRAKLQKEVEELRKVYGMPDKDYKCPICLRNEEEASEGETKRSWVLDHCHDTNTFRGWLCGKCNRDLGNFNNDVDTFKKAGVSSDQVPEAVTNALTRDYSDLMKAMNKKGK